MTKICAFVGHSFLPDDEQVINKFARLFDSMSRVKREFSWDHALAAQPVSISEKVLNLTSDKNVFIAICTRRERVTKAPGKRWPLLDRVVFRADDFQWKTSDWIIQETGLARGLRLSSIIFLEKDVRPPSGLLSDLEYISFDRANPEACAGQFMDMVAALVPQETTKVAVQSEAPTSPPPVEPKSEPPADEVKTWSNPQPGWTNRRYEDALFIALVKKDAEAEEKIFTAYAHSDIAKEPGALTAWDSYRELLRIQYGTDGSVTNLKKLVEKAPDNSRVHANLGEAYEHFNHFSDAAAAFEQAASYAPTLDKKVSCSAKRQRPIARLGTSQRLKQPYRNPVQSLRTNRMRNRPFWKGRRTPFLPRKITSF